MSPMHRLIYDLPADREEDLVAALWELGTLGVQVLDGAPGRVRVEAYFEEPLPGGVEGVDAATGAELAGREPVVEEDWLAPYRELARPVRVGERFLLDPREPDGPVAVDAGRIALRIPARAAFGTGSHESTRLVLELLERVDLSGRRVLDVGCGTGVLSLAALRLGARRAVGFDVDPGAPFHARENRRLNDLGPAEVPLFAGTLSALRTLHPDQRFDLALVNVIPEEILPELEGLVPLLAPGAEALFSGILVAFGERVAAELAACGFERFERREVGEWVAFRTSCPGEAV